MGTGKTIKNNMGLLSATSNMLINSDKMRIKERNSKRYTIWKGCRSLA